MKLLIKRSIESKKGLLGGDKGATYKIYARLDVSPDEKALIEKCHAGDIGLSTYTMYEGKKHEDTRSVILSDVLEGITISTERFTELQRIELEIRQESKTIKSLIPYFEAFEQEEVIEL